MGEKLVKMLLNSYRNQWVEIVVRNKKTGGYLVKSGRKWDVNKIVFSQHEVAHFDVYQFAEPTITIVFD